MKSDELSRIRASFGLAALISLVLCGIAWASFIAPKSPVSSKVIWVLIALVALGLLILLVVVNRKRFEPLRTILAGDWFAILAPLIGAGALLLSAARAGWAPLWILQGDMVWNTAQSLFIYRDGGLVSSVHPNPAPLTNEIFAILYGPQASLDTVFKVHSIVAVGLVFLISLLSGWYASSRLRNLHPFLRFCIVFGVGWIPFTSMLMDPLMRLGHVNTLTSLLLLWAAWVVFDEEAIKPGVRVGLLGVTSTALAASWAPLAVVPMVLGCLLLVRVWISSRPVWRKPNISSLVGLLSIAQFGLYVVAVTLPDLKREGSALGSNGATTLLTSWGALIICIVVVLVACLTLQAFPKGSRESLNSLAILLVLLVSTVVFVFLIWQRISSGNPFWGYYPVKLVSLVLLLSLPLTFIFIGDLATKRPSFFEKFTVAALALPLFLFSLLSYSNWGLTVDVLFPTLKAAKADVAAGQIESLRDLSIVKEGDTDDSVSVFYDWGPQDDLADAYLLQLEAEGPHDPIRWFAYFFDRSDSGLWCRFVTETPGEIRVFTSQPASEFTSDTLKNCEVPSDKVSVLNELER